MPRASGKYSNEKHLRQVAKPFNIYMIFAIMAVFIITGAYLVKGPITALVTGTGTPGTSQAVIVSFPDFGPEPVCNNMCGKPCWLGVTGSLPVTYNSSRGKIGVVGCNGMCFDIDEFVSQKMCCQHSGCPRDEPVCRQQSDRNALCYSTGTH